MRLASYKISLIHFGMISSQEAWLLEQAEEDDYRLTDEICQTDADECNRRLAMLADAYDQANSRSKRSADEEALLEMALLTEGSYEASISSVSDTSVTFSFPQLPAGKYDIIVNRSVMIGDIKANWILQERRSRKRCE